MVRRDDWRTWFIFCFRCSVDKVNHKEIPHWTAGFKSEPFVVLSVFVVSNGMISIVFLVNKVREVLTG